MAKKVDDRFKKVVEPKTYETFERDAKASELYDTFDAADLERAKTDVEYGYGLLSDKKGWKESKIQGDTDSEDFYVGLARTRRVEHDLKYPDKTSNALAAIKAYDASLPGDKSSKYMTMIDNLFGQIAGDKFAYDAKSDPRYALAEEYAQRAMENQMAESALLSGGYGNSFAAASGQQVYTDYMNDAVNDMEDRAYQKWSAERDNKYNLLGIAQGLEERDYNRSIYDKEYTHMLERKAIEDARYADETAYARSQDAIANQQWQDQFNYNKSQDAIANQQWQDQFEYNKSQDAIANQQWQNQFEYNKSKTENDELSNYDEITNLAYTILEADDGKGSSIGDLVAMLNEAKHGKLVGTSDIKLIIDRLTKDGIITPVGADYVYKKVL